MLWHRSGSLLWAHPRVGGEDSSRTASAMASMGSPPRRRGRPPRLRFSAGRVGAHPRVGGEDVTLLPRYSLTAGSPPRRRGRLRVLVPLMLVVRLTPA